MASSPGVLGVSLSELRGEKDEKCAAGELEPELSLPEGDTRLIGPCERLEGPGVSQGSSISPAEGLAS